MENVVHVPKLPILIACGFSPSEILLKAMDKPLDHFRAQGYDITVIPFRLGDMRDVQTFAGHIVLEVGAARVTRPGLKVNLIGLSMGGVAGMYAIKRLGIAEYVDTFVGVGAPFYGSFWSWFAVTTGVFKRTGSQLSLGSPFLQKLRDEPLPDGPRYVTIAGSDDRICPPKTALLPGTDQHVEKFDHNAIFRKRKVFERVFCHCR